MLPLISALLSQTVQQKKKKKNSQSSCLEQVVVVFRPCFFSLLRSKIGLRLGKPAILIDHCQLLNNVVMESDRTIVSCESSLNREQDPHLFSMTKSTQHTAGNASSRASAKQSGLIFPSLKVRI